jgi:hypoxanthine phosphoribosyltransferase
MPAPREEGVMKVLLAHDAIQARVLEMGKDIARDYAGREPHLVCVLKGACTFMTDLSRAIDLNLTLDYIAVSSYGAATKSSGEVKLVKDLDQGLEGRDLLVVEDIVDTGPHPQLPLERAARPRAAHAEGRGPPLQAVAALVEIPVDYVGFSIEDHFVVGYGLDYNEKYRTSATSWCTGARQSQHVEPPRALGQAPRRARRRCVAAATCEGGLRGGRAAATAVVAECPP